MAEGYVDTLIKEMSINITTNDRGAAQISGITTKNAIVSVSASDTQVMFIPWIYNGNNWYVTAINWVSWAQIPNAQYTITVRYI